MMMPVRCSVVCSPGTSHCPHAPATTTNYACESRATSSATVTGLPEVMQTSDCCCCNDRLVFRAAGPLWPFTGHPAELSPARPAQLKGIVAFDA